MTTSIFIVDDHYMVIEGIRSLLQNDKGIEWAGHAMTASSCLAYLEKHQPDVILMDINMPEMDGFATAQWIKQTYPLIKVLALSMYDNENSVIRMFKAGAKGYILKDSEPSELRAALDSVMTKGYYYSELVTGKLIHSINTLDENADVRNLVQLNDREIDFLKYACTEMTYKEIADKMFLSPRTIDGYRDALFEKLDIKTRVGLVMYAIKNGIVQV